MFVSCCCETITQALEMLQYALGNSSVSSVLCVRCIADSLRIASSLWLTSNNGEVAVDIAPDE